MCTSLWQFCGNVYLYFSCLVHKVYQTVQHREEIAAEILALRLNDYVHNIDMRA